MGENICRLHIDKDVNSKKPTEKDLTALVIRKIQIKTTIWHYLTPIRMQKSTDSTMCWWEYITTRVLILLGGMQNVTTILESWTLWWFLVSFQVNHKPTIQSHYPAVPLRGTCSEMTTEFTQKPFFIIINAN